MPEEVERFIARCQFRGISPSLTELELRWRVELEKEKRRQEKEKE